MKVGQVKSGDLVMTDLGVVAKVRSIWQRVPHGRFVVEVDEYECINNDIRVRSSTRTSHAFLYAESIIDVLIWYEDSPGIIRCAVPPALLFANA